MDGDDSGADGFEFNLTRVLESLDRRLAAAPDPSPLTPPPTLGAPAATLTPDPPPAPTFAAPAVALAPDPPTPPAAPLPHRVPSQRGSQQTRPAPRPTRLTPDAAEPLPTRARTAAPAAPPQAPPDPLPTRTAAPTPAAVAPGRRSMFDEAASGEARAALHRVPADTNVAVAALDVPALPTLPPVRATPPPEVAARAATPMPTVADVRQFQNAQRRQARKNREGRVMGRFMLVVVLFAAGVGLALTVGRDYLFPAGWADELAAVAADVEASRGAEFTAAVPLVDQPPAEYATTLARVVLGPDPEARVALWRALGLTNGISSESLGTSLLAMYPAVFDAETGSIVRPLGGGADFRQPLAAALDHQLGAAQAGPIGVLAQMPPAPAPAAPAPATTQGPARAEDVIRDLTGDEAPPPANDLTLPNVEPIPVEQLAEQQAAAEQALADQLASMDSMTQLTGAPVLYVAMAGQIVAPILLDEGLVMPAEPKTLAPEAVLAAGDTPLGDHVSLGLDSWTMVWSNRLPSDSVDTLIAATQADSIRIFERHGVVCAGAVFEARNELFATATATELGRWAAAAPVEAQAAVTELSPTHVQLVTCDPGVEVVQEISYQAVNAVMYRHADRIVEAMSGTASEPATSTTLSPTTAP